MERLIKTVNMDPISNVSRPKSSMWVSANAGSGKTKNLVTRVARLLIQGASPEKILCLTYTTAAATEMQERLFKVLGSWSMKSDESLKQTLLALDESFFSSSVDQLVLLNTARRLFAKALETPGGLKIQTIHGFCNSILRKFPLEIGISPNFKVLDERQQQTVIKKAIVDLVKNDPSAFDDVIKVLAISDIDYFVEQILINRSLLVKPIDLDEFCKVFSLSNRYLISNTELEMIFDGLPEDIIKIIISALMSGSTADMRQAQHLKRVETSGDFEKLENLKKFFCTRDGKIRSKRSFPSQKAQLLNRDLGKLFTQFKTNFLHHLKRVGEFNTIKKVTVLYDFSNRFLKIYDGIKFADNFLDYEDLIIKTRDLLTNFNAKWVLFKVDGGIDHILLDEAQDTSIRQWEMLAALMDDFFSDERSLLGERTFYAVGDDKQSIYSFQGADIKFFYLMKGFFSEKLSSGGNKLETVELSNSFRSSKAILSFVNEIIADDGGMGVSDVNDHVAFYKDLPGKVELWPLVTGTGRGVSKPWWNFERDAIRLPAVDHLAKKITLKIKKILESEKKIFDPSSKDIQRKILPGDFLILVRRRGPLFKSILKELTKHDLPVAGSDRLKLSDELAIKDITSLLKFLINQNDDLSLAETLRSPLLGLSENELFKIAHDRKGSLFDSLKLVFPNHDACRILDALVEDAKILTPYELIEKLLICYDGRLRMSARLGRSVNDILDEFLVQALNYEESEPPSIFGFIVWLASTNVAIKRPLNNNSLNIRVMTIHGAKGLEAPIVIIADAFSTKRPSNKRLFLQKEGWLCLWDNGALLPDQIELLKEEKLRNEIEEENRLFYVAITRARSWLIICGLRKNKEEEGSSRSNWYFRSKKALKQLIAKKNHSFEIKDQEKLVFTHNWK